MFKNRIFTLFLLFTLGLPLSLAAKEESSMITKEFKLDNGLKIVVREDHRAPVVVSQVWYKVGAADEHNGITGISHMLEHMMFKGTEKVPGDTFSKTISENGGNDNAFTADDFTAYYEEMDASKLALLFELEADRMENLILVDEDFQPERKVVMEERRLRTEDNPNSLTYERFMAHANVTGPYHHPVIGWMHDIEQYQLSDLQKWYDNYYGPNNAVLVVVGAVKADEVYELAKTHFGKVKKKAAPQGKQGQEVPMPGLTRIELNLPAKLPYMMMGWNVPAINALKEEDKWEAYALVVASHALSGGESSRFAKELVRGMEMAATVNSYYDMIKRYNSLFMVMGIPKDHISLSTFEGAILEEVNKLKTTPIDQKELERIQTQIIAEEVFDKDSMAHQAIMIGELEATGLSWKFMDTYIENIKAVTPEQVQKVANKYFINDGLTVAYMNPQKIN